MPSIRPVRTLALLFAAALYVAPAAGIAGPAGIGYDNTLAARKGKARTVAEMSALYDSTHCEDCHPKVYRAWELSAHSEPIMGKRRPGRKAGAIMTIFEVARAEWPFTKLDNAADVKVEHLMGCCKCHLPQLADAEDSVARELVGDIARWQDAKKTGDAKTVSAVERKLEGLSVTCLICHNRNAVVHQWIDGPPQARAVYGSANKPHPVGKFPTVRQSPIQDEAIACGQCHGLGPLLDRDNPTQCPTVYGSYLFDYKARGGDEVCQDCHMRRSELGHNIQSYRDPYMIGAALEFLVDVMAAPQDARKLRVTVEMTNKAGHPIPDGCPTTTRLILDVAAKTPDGNEFFFDERTYMPIPQNYGRGDKMGKGPFEKTSLIIDTALPPLRKVTERYDIPIPPGLADAVGKGEIEIEARLTYLPYGSTIAADDPVVWRKVIRKLKLGESE